jgi:probable phosphoglycerate mutase
VTGTRVALVRHGLPELGDTVDPGLSEAGWAQARATAHLLAADEPVAVYSSHLQRARDTAAAIAEPLALPVEVDEDLREWDSFTPQPRYRPPEALEAGPRRAAFQDGRFEEFLPPHDKAGLQARVAAALRRVAEKHPARPVVVVSHGGAINAFLALVLGTTSTFFFDPAYAGVSRVRVMTDGRFVLDSINETAHLVRRP